MAAPRYRSYRGIRHKMYVDLNACAIHAADAFQRQGWHWSTGLNMGQHGVETTGAYTPTVDQIKEELEKLRKLGLEGHEYKGKQIPGTGFATGGRLMYQRGPTGDEFGHEVEPRPRRDPDDDLPAEPTGVIVPMMSVADLMGHMDSFISEVSQMIDGAPPGSLEVTLHEENPEPEDESAPKRVFRDSD